MKNINQEIKDMSSKALEDFGVSEYKRMNMKGTTVMEKDPNGIDLKTPGSKADYGKKAVMQGTFHYFPRALLEVAGVSQRGAEKYSWKGWESVDNGQARYGDALARHILAEAIEGPYDKDTGLLHAAQIAWNSLARLELILREKENEKPKPGSWIEVSSEEAKKLGLK